MPRMNSLIWKCDGCNHEERVMHTTSYNKSPLSGWMWITLDNAAEVGADLSEVTFRHEEYVFHCERCFVEWAMRGGYRK